MRRVAALGIGQRVAIDVAANDLAADRRVFVRGLGVVGHRGCVVHRIDGDRDGAGRRAAMAIAHRDGERVGAVEVGVRGVGVGAVRVDRDRAVRGVAALHVGQRVAIDVAANHLTADGCVFVRGLSVVRHRGGVVHRVDGDRDGAGRRATVAVAHRHREAVGTVEIGSRDVGVGAVGIDRDGAVRWIAALGIGQRVAIDVAANDLAADRRVFVRGLVVVGRRRRVVDRVDGHVHRAGGRAAVAVAHRHGEAVRTVEVGTRGVGVGAVRVDRDGAMCRVAALHVRERVAVHVTANHLAADRRVFVRGLGVVGRRRRIVHRIDRHRHRAGRRTAMAIAHCDSERIGAVEVRVRRVGVRAVRVDRDRAVRRVAALRVGQRVAAVDVAAGHAAAHGRVFGRDLGVVGRGGRVVHGRDGHGHRDGGGAALAVADGHLEAVGPFIAGLGRVDELARGRIDGDGAVLGALGDGVVQRVTVGVGRLHLSANGLVLIGDDRVGLAFGAAVLRGKQRRNEGRGATAAATTTARGGTDAQHAKRAQQPARHAVGQQGAAGVVPFDLGEVEVFPWRGVLAPPLHAGAVFEHEVVAAGVGVLGEEAAHGDFLAVAQHEHEVVAAALELEHALGRDLQRDDRRAIQNQRGFRRRFAG
ncbi:hypothetical protein D3C85_279580 [compost metagenome]